jgi:hypothetical protein
MENATGDGFFVVFGGAGFTADTQYLDSVGLNPLYNDNYANVVDFDSTLPSTPADGTLVREIDQSDVFVVVGGAKFWITNQPETFIDLWDLKLSIPNLALLELGFNWGQVRVIPDGGTAQLQTMPIDGTLLRELHGAEVFLVANGQLRWVTSPTVMDTRCLSWRNVRVVPDNTLAALPRGNDLT